MNNELNGEHGQQDLEILDFIKTFPFPDTPFALDNKGQLSEVKMRGVARYISTRIQRYVDLEKEDQQVVDWLRSKIDPQEFIKFVNGKSIKDLLDAKTLKRCFQDGKFSDTTIKIFKAFKKVIIHDQAQKDSLDRVKGYYYLFNSHNTTSESVQVSMLNLRAEGPSLLKYKNRNHKEVEDDVKAEIIDNNKLLLSIRKRKSALIFYGYISPDQKDIPFLQAVFIYSNRSNKTIANIAVLARVFDQEDYLAEAVFNKFKPKRELEYLSDDNFHGAEQVFKNRIVKKSLGVSVLQNIQYYLLNRTKPVLPKVYNNTKPFDFSKDISCYPSINQREALHYNRAKSYEGEYFIYFNEAFPSVRREQAYLKNNTYFSSVGRGVLHIEKDKTTGVLKCIMWTRKNPEGDVLVHTGNVINHTLNTGDCLIIAMYLESDKDRYLNLLLNVIDERQFVGSFSISYSYPRKLGCGAVTVIRQQLVLKEGYDDRELEKIKTTPTSFYADIFTSKSKLEQSVVAYLSNNEKSMVKPPEFSVLKSCQSNIYEGLYKMYNLSYKQNMRVSLLRINANGSAVHISSNKKEVDIGQGKVEQADSVMSLFLKNNKTGRTGFCCIKTGINITPRRSEDLEDQTIYLGTFSGVSRKEGARPVASKFVLEFLDKKGQFNKHEGKIVFAPQEFNTEIEDDFIKDVKKYLTKTKGHNSFISVEAEVYNKKDFRHWVSKMKD